MLASSYERLSTLLASCRELMDRTRREGRKLVAAQPSGESHSVTGETHSQVSAASGIRSPPYMQIRERRCRKTCLVQSCWLVLGKQKVDTQGALPDHSSFVSISRNESYSAKFCESLILQISQSFNHSRKYFNENFWHTVCSVCVQRIRKLVSTKSSKITIRKKNLDPQKFSTIRYCSCLASISAPGSWTRSCVSYCPPHPPLSTFCLPDVAACDKISLASSLLLGWQRRGYGRI